MKIKKGNFELIIKGQVTLFRLDEGRKHFYVALPIAFSVDFNQHYKMVNIYFLCFHVAFSKWGNK